MNMLVFLRSNEHLGQDPSTLAGPSTAPLSPLLGQDVNCPGLSLVAGVLEPGGCQDVFSPALLGQTDAERLIRGGSPGGEMMERSAWLQIGRAHV